MAKIKIIMDERERGSIREKFLQTDVDLEIQTLDFGDYVISSRCAIERKRGDDFVSSIFDQRLFIQLEKLKNAYPYPILILEEPARLFTRKFVNDKSIFGALVYVSTRLGIPIIPTRDDKDTIQMICRLAQKEMENGWNLTSSPACYEREGDFQVTRSDQEYFLQGLVDIGYSRACSFLNLYQSPEFFFHALELSTVECTKGGNPKALSGILSSVSGIGPKIVFRNQKLLHTSYKQAKKEKIKTKTP